MPLVGFKCEQAPWAFATIEACEKCTKRCLPSIEVLRALWAENFEDDHPYHSDPKVVSLTTALGCLRKAFYDRTIDYGEAPEKLMARTTGTVLHRWLEEKSPQGAEVVHEMDLSRGYKLMATADVEHPGIVRDFKTVDRPTKTLGGAVFEDDGEKVHNYARQLSFFADLRESRGEDPITELSVIQVSRKAVASHEAYRVPNTMDYVVRRAEGLVDALELKCVDALPLDGENMKFYRSNLCGFCAFKEECGNDD